MNSFFLFSSNIRMLTKKKINRCIHKNMEDTTKAFSTLGRAIRRQFFARPRKPFAKRNIFNLFIGIFGAGSKKKTKIMTFWVRRWSAEIKLIVGCLCLVQE